VNLVLRNAGACGNRHASLVIMAGRPALFCRIIHLQRWLHGQEPLVVSRTSSRPGLLTHDRSGARVSRETVPPARAICRSNLDSHNSHVAVPKTSQRAVLISSSRPLRSKGRVPGPINLGHGGVPSAIRPALQPASQQASYCIRDSAKSASPITETTADSEASFNELTGAIQELAERGRRGAGPGSSSTFHVKHGDRKERPT
jgi:hypothetical protein